MEEGRSSVRPGRAFLAVVCSLLFSCGLAAGDGKFFSAADDVREPNQKALLWLENGRETLILQVKYEGAAGDFGWVVPVPGRPKIDTAPGDLFHELAIVTQSIVVLPGAARRGSRGPAGGAAEGVEVVERVQVGPYDATVLAATDEGALAGWLREHGYRMPLGAEDVLASYVARGWYYVALRIDTARLGEELLARLRLVEPKIGSLEGAPDRAAELVVKLAGNGEPSCLDVANKLGQIVDAALGGAEGTTDVLGSEPDSASQGSARQRAGLAHQESMYGAMLVSEADQVLVAAEMFRQGPLDERDVMSCVQTCAGLYGASRVKEAAKAAGIPGDGSSAEVSRSLAALGNRDLSNGVRYDTGEWRRWPRFVARARSGKPIDLSAYEHDYEVMLELMRACRGLRPRPEIVAADGGQDLGIGTDMLMAAAAHRALDYMRKRGELYHRTREAVLGAAGAVENALHSGSIQPLLLEFGARELVYPLYITSLGAGRTDIQLYVLSDHRAEAGGHGTVYGEEFRTAFAGRLDERSLTVAPILTKYVAPGCSYLTELRANLEPSDMTADVSFRQAATDDGFRERVTGGGRGAAGPRAEHPLRGLGWLAGIGLVALVAGIAIGRALSDRSFRVRRAARKALGEVEEE
jgi:hypothetical protein